MVAEVAALPLFLDRQLPETVGELEAALGVTLAFASPDDYSMGSAYLPADPAERLSPLVEGLIIRYGWDVYHQHPLETLAQLRQKSLSAWTARFTEGSDRCQALLQARYGAPKPLSDGKLAFLVYGPLYLCAGAAGNFTLSFYERTPDWAVTVEPGAREALLRALADALENTPDADALASIAGRAPESAGLTGADRSDEGDAFSFELKPPLRARDLVALFGWRNVVGVSHDFHMSSWTIEEVTGVNEYRLETAAPRRGRWRIVATLDRSPSGDRCPECRVGPIGQRRLGDEDPVRYLRFKRLELDGSAP